MEHIEENITITKGNLDCSSDNYLIVILLIIMNNLIR